MTGPRPLDRREMAAWHGMLRAHAALVRTLTAELEAEQGMSLPAYEVLAHLSEAPGRRIRMTELASCALLSPSGLTRLVDKLARDGLVCRERCGQDARVVYAVLTDQGCSRLQQAYPTHLRGVREHVIDRLDRGDLDVLAAAMRQLLGAASPTD